MDDKKTIEVYDSKVEDYIKLTDRPPGKPLTDFISKVGPDGLVLDLGCGPGTSAAVMRLSGLKVDPVDASTKMVEIANMKYQLNARKLRFDEISGEHIYDGVWANFSLLHARKNNFINYLNLIYLALKPRGLFSIGMKLGSGEHRDGLGRFYAYYGRDELISCLSRCGFVFDTEYIGEEKGLTGHVEPWIVAQSRKLC